MISISFDASLEEAKILIIQFETSIEFVTEQVWQDWPIYAYRLGKFLKPVATIFGRLLWQYLKSGLLFFYCKHHLSFLLDLLVTQAA